VILFEIETTIDDNPKTFNNCIYEGDEAIVLAWFLIPGIDHYFWLCNPINQLPSNHKIEHLVPLVEKCQFATTICD
jgi:hypothetical protein